MAADGIEMRGGLSTGGPPTHRGLYHWQGRSDHAWRSRCYRSAVKRRLLIAAIFLLAGAVVNVGVAWAIAAHLETFDIDWVFDGRVYLEDPESFKWWTTHAPDGFAKRAGWVMLSSPITGASVVLAESRRLNESYEETG